MKAFDLNSVGCVILPDGNTYPKLADGGIDWDMAVHVSEIEDDEDFLSSMDSYDRGVFDFVVTMCEK